MGLFNRTDPVESNLVTYYKEEDGLHPQFKNAFDWFAENVLTHVADGWQEDFVLAGGALRSYFTSTPVRDFDIYLNAKALGQFTNNYTDALKMSHSWTKMSDTDLSWTYKKLDYNTEKQRLDDITFNIMKQSYESREEVISRFDYTVCMCAIQKGAITHHPDYFTDLATRSLRANNLEDALSSMWRLQKYIKLGYTIDRDDMWELAEAIHELNVLPTLVKTKDDKAHNTKTLEEIFRAS